MTAPLVSIRGLTLEAATARGTARILSGVDLDIGRGRILGIVGESGSGKSSLASCLLRLLPANVTRLSGQVDFAGTELLGLTDAAMAGLRGTRIAMIFQDPMTALNPLFTIGTHLVDVIRRRAPGVPRREALARAEAMLARVAIPDARDRLTAYPHQLSGGMRQRVMIAMALLAGPELLLADEPTTALDATVEAQIVALLDALRSEVAGSIVFISHHLGLVAQLCDDLCVMYGGTVVETGPVGSVLDGPRHPYTRALLACEIEDGDEGRLVSIPGEVPDPVQPPPGCIFAPRCEFVRDHCRAEVPAAREIAPQRRSACHFAETLP
ncbi:ABC transporter ATP-binding protein [Falsiroseomonas sp. HW251]|uniref:ABC transporter ATP-binding protein n=1 Tax=Falsiroseomonas sp. HW251 TaxID=3390998 RepID=UPI003D312275